MQDRGENTAMMGPMIVGQNAPERERLNDLALELAAASSELRGALADSHAGAVADLVRAMNCYYSNLIEGHDTHPVDIERALNNDFSQDPKQRELQKEARAHIEVQAWIDAGGIDGRATDEDALREIHRRFCELLPEELLRVQHPETGERVRVCPGEYRSHDVQVGRHVAVSPGAVPRFMSRFEHAYSGLGKMDRVLAAASAHHRLLWIHPWSDGNGRVARLMSYALLRETLNTRGLWSVARGLARNEADYKRHLANSDLPRRNDLDGRGALSQEELARFTEFFLSVSLDQVRFMEQLIEPRGLRDRILLWAEEEMRAGRLPSHSDTLLKETLYRGEIPRGEVSTLIGTSDRTARRATSALVGAGVLRSSSSRAPLKLAFPAALAHRWLPGLFPPG
ncbi:MAG: Fic family protein [Myxococcota bacterium]